MLAHRHYETFKARLNWKQGDDRHTAEGSILGARIVTTDDPENIKAILATQFKDFGPYLFSDFQSMRVR
jgi:hypothetical protein